LKFVLSVITAALIGTTSANAATMEQVAAAAGQIHAGYARAKLLCSVAGIPMPTFEQAFPDTAQTNGQLKSEYPEAYAIGARKGTRQAENMLEDKRDVPDVCAKYKKGFK
jgi:hypothetical protein